MVKIKSLFLVSSVRRVDPKTIDTIENTMKKRKSIKYLFGKCGHVKNNNKFLSTLFLAQKDNVSKNVVTEVSCSLESNSHKNLFVDLN